MQTTEIRLSTIYYNGKKSVNKKNNSIFIKYGTITVSIKEKALYINIHMDGKVSGIVFIFDLLLDINRLHVENNITNTHFRFESNYKHEKVKITNLGLLGVSDYKVFLDNLKTNDLFILNISDTKDFDFLNQYQFTNLTYLYINITFTEKFYSLLQYCWNKETKLNLDKVNLSNKYGRMLHLIPKLKPWNYLIDTRKNTITNKDLITIIEEISLGEFIENEILV